MIKYIIPFLLLFSSCYYDNQEDLYQYLNNCDTTNVTFTNSVMPIIASECSFCHQGQNMLGGVSLNNYDEVMIYVTNNELLSDVKGETNVMPKSGMMLDCKIKIIEKWINDGATNN